MKLNILNVHNVLEAFKLRKQYNYLNKDLNTIKKGKQESIANKSTAANKNLFYQFVYFGHHFVTKKVREKSRECNNHKPQPFPDPKRKPTNLNKHKPNKRTKSTKISSLFPKRGNRNTKRTEKHKNKMTHGKTYNKSPRRINHKATKPFQKVPPHLKIHNNWTSMK